MKIRILNFAPALVVCALTACSDNLVPNYNAGSVSELETSPTPVSIATAAQGMFYTTRTDMEFYTIILGSMGREGYSLIPSDAGWQNNLSTMASSFYSSSFTGWKEHYRDIRQGNSVLHALDKVAGLTDAEKEGYRGFVKTMQAMDFLIVLNTRWDNGAPVDVDRTLDADLAPIVTKDEQFKNINKLLDDAKTSLGKAGGAFKFTLTPGFAGFNTPATFLKFNRGLRARVAVYNNDWAGALTALQESFLDVNGSLATGVSHSWSNNSGDQPLQYLYDPSGNQMRVQKDFVTQAQLRADGSVDLRVSTKTQKLDVRTFKNLTSEYRFTNYSSAASPLPIIRNEELILLRAEANIGLGNKAAAIADLNVIRTRSGGLAPLPADYSGDLLTELLYNKRYSLAWEGGHRWLDLRHYGKLADLPVDRTGDKRFTAIPIPDEECLPRTPRPAGCTIPVGF
jgi:starch-binding outer membrane protein, SusD/RagB family